MIEQVNCVVDALEKKYPYAQLLFKFDHSSNHKSKYANALNAKTMNLSNGGKQPFMHGSSFKRNDVEVKQEFVVVSEGGVMLQKGLSLACQERGYDVHGKTVEDLRAWMGRRSCIIVAPRAG